jgi:hypothetical protein
VLQARKLGLKPFWTSCLKTNRLLALENLSSSSKMLACTDNTCLGFLHCTEVPHTGVSRVAFPYDSSTDRQEIPIYKLIGVEGLLLLAVMFAHLKKQGAIESCN